MAQGWFESNAPKQDWFAKNAPSSGPGRAGRKSLAQDMTERGLDPTPPKYSPGVTHMVQGGKDIGEGNVARGAHQILSGVGTVSAPLAAMALPIAPAATIIGAGGSMLGGAAGRKIASSMDASEDVQDLAGDVGSIAGGAAGAKFGPQLVRGVKATAPKGIKTKFAEFRRGWGGEKPVTTWEPNAPTAKPNMPKFTPGDETVSGKRAASVGMKGAPAPPAKAPVVPWQPNRVNPNIARQLRHTPETPAGARKSYPAARRSGPLAAPKTTEAVTPPKAGTGGVYPSKAVPEEAASIASVMTKHGISRADAAKMTPSEWQLVASNAGLKSMPSPETIHAAVAKLEGGKPLRVRRTQAGR